MKKSELIDVILGYENLGEMTREELEKHTVKELSLLKKEMDDELAKENGTPEPEEKEEKEEPVEPKSEEPVETFSSMCGFNFDPSANSGCMTQCVNDYPDSFKKCQEHFSAQPAKKAAKPKGLGMNIWYHRPSSQGAVIDQLLLDGKVVSFADIAEAGGGTRARVLSHLNHLVADWTLDICKGQKKGEDGKMIEAYFWRDKNKSRKGETLAGKTAYPNGLPKNHPLQGKIELEK